MPGGGYKKSFDIIRNFGLHVDYGKCGYTLYRCLMRNTFLWSWSGSFFVCSRDLQG